MIIVQLQIDTPKIGLYSTLRHRPFPLVSILILYVNFKMEWFFGDHANFQRSLVHGTNAVSVFDTLVKKSL